MPRTSSPSVGRAAVPLPTLTQPLSMVLAGQRRQLVVCVVSDLAPSSGHAVWISGGNGNILQSFAYGASQEEGGTVCSVSLLSSDPPRERELACHVGANRSSPSHSSSPIRITGMTLLPPPALPRPPLPSLAGALLGPEEGGGGGQGLWGQQGAGVRPWGKRCCSDHRKGFVASPAVHLVLGCRHPPSCSLIPQATRRRQSCVAQLVSLWALLGGNVRCQGESPGSGLAGAKWRLGRVFSTVLWDWGRGREASPWWEEWGN